MIKRRQAAAAPPPRAMGGAAFAPSQRRAAKPAARNFAGTRRPVRTAAFASPASRSAGGGDEGSSASKPAADVPPLRFRVRVPQQAPGQIPLLAGMAIAAAAGCIGEIVTNPIEVVRTRIQCQRADAPIYRGSADCFHKIIKQEGVGAFGAGLGMSLALECVQTPLSLGLVDPLLKLACGGNPKKAPLWKRIPVAAFCGMLSCLVVYPLDTIKFRAQMVENAAHGHAAGGPVQRFLAATAEAFSDLPALYRGCRTSAMKAAAGCGIGTTTYQCVRNAIEESHLLPEGAAAVDLLSAFTSTTAVVGILNPLDIVRMRQYEEGSGTFLAELGHVLREGGPQALWAGVFTSLCVSAPDRMTTYYFMEQFRRAFRDGAPERRARALTLAAFKAVDKDGDGRLTPGELREAFIAAHPLGPMGADGIRMDDRAYEAFVDREVAAMMREGDRDKDGSVSREESARIAHRLTQVVRIQEQRAAFEAIDANRSGHITADELLAAMRHVAPRHLQSDSGHWHLAHLSEERYEAALRRDVAALLRRADRDGDGRVSFPEFAKMVEKVDDVCHGRALAAWARTAGLALANY